MAREPEIGLNNTGRRGAVRLLLALALVLLGVGAAAPALADDPPGDAAQSADAYEPTGMGPLISTPDLGEGQDPTLFEAYPEDAYEWDYQDRSGFHPIEGTVDPPFNALANAVFSLTRSWTRTAIGLTWQTMTFDSYTSLGSQLTDSIGAIAGAFVDWLLPSALIIGGLLVWWKLGDGVGQAVTQLGYVAALGVVALTIATYPGVWVDGINTVRGLGSNAATSVAMAGTGDLQVPFAGPTPTFGDDARNTGMRKMGDAVWRTFVVTPWCMGEFGNMDSCQQWGQGVIERPKGPDNDESYRAGYIWKVIQPAVGGNDSAAYRTVSGHETAGRLALAVLSLLAAFVFTILVLCLNCFIALNLMLSLMMLALGGFFTMVWAIPGAPRQWGNNWLQLLFGFTIVSFLGQLVLSVTLTVAVAAISLTASMGWASSVVLTLTCMVAALVLMRHLRSIFSVGTTGAQGLFGTVLAGAYMMRSLMRRGPRPPKPPKEPRPRRASGAPGWGEGQDPQAPAGMPGPWGGNVPRRQPTGTLPSQEARKAIPAAPAPAGAPQGRYERAQGRVPRELPAPRPPRALPPGPTTAETPVKAPTITAGADASQRVDAADYTGAAPTGATRPRIYTAPAPAGPGPRTRPPGAPRRGSGVGDPHLRSNAPRRPRRAPVRVVEGRAARD